MLLTCEALGTFQSRQLGRWQLHKLAKYFPAIANVLYWLAMADIVGSYRSILCGVGSQDTLPLELHIIRDIARGRGSLSKFRQGVRDVTLRSHTYISAALAVLDCSAFPQELRSSKMKNTCRLLECPRTA